MPNPNVSALPAAGSTSWYTHYQSLDQAVRIANGPRVHLDSFTDATDTAKLASAMSYAAAQTYKPVIELANRSHSFTAALGKAYDGFAMVGGGIGWPNREQTSQRTTVTVTGAPWLDVGTSSASWAWAFAGIEFVGGGTTTQFMRATSSTAALWKFYGKDLGFQNFAGVFGNNAETCFIDLCTFTGAWSMLSPLDTQVNIGGADCLDLWTSGSLNIGGGSTGPVAGGGGNRFLMIFNGLSKSNVANVYNTADNGWRGMLFKGSKSSGYGLGVRGCVVEGRNPATPCPGNLVRVEGGAVDFQQMNVNCGMAAPSATGNANGIADRALFEVVGTDSQVGIDGMTVSHATGVPITTPVIYADGTAGNVWVRASRVYRSTRSGSPSWGTSLPVVSQSATGLLLDRDSSTTLV